MNMRTIQSINVPLTRRVQNVFTRRWFATEKGTEVADVFNVDETPIYADNVKEEEADLDKKRDKSSLTSGHRNILFGRKPYSESMAWYHNTVKYKRRILGRYGMEALGVPAGVAWPTPEEVKEAKKYESIAFPLSLQERWEKIKEGHKQHEAYIEEREREISKKMAKMDDWIQELHKRREKKERELTEAKERREKLIEEVRRHFGFRISPNDERFKEMFAKKEKEDKKRMKEAKQKARQLKTQQQATLLNEPITEESLSKSETAGDPATSTKDQ